MMQQKMNCGIYILIAIVMGVPVIAGAHIAGSTSYTLEAMVMDGAGNAANSVNYALLSATAQPAVTGAGAASAYAAGHGFIGALAELLGEGEPVEGESAEGEMEGEVVEGETMEGESTEGETEGESTEGETQEGEIEGEEPEGETEGEGMEGEPGEGEGEDGCCGGCGCTGDVKADFNRYLGDYLLIGLSLVALLAVAGKRS